MRKNTQVKKVSNSRGLGSLKTNFEYKLCHLWYIVLEKPCQFFFSLAKVHGADSGLVYTSTAILFIKY